MDQEHSQEGAESGRALALVEGERARARRFASRSSLVSLELPPQEALEAVGSLSSRLRSTDAVIHSAPGRVDVLLRDTPPARAGAVVEGLDAALPAGSWQPTAILPSDEQEDAQRGEERPILVQESESVSVSCDPAGVLTLFSRELPAWKRAADVVVSLLGLVLLSPLLLLIAVAVKVTSPGPVLFRQERTGQGLRRFAILKFRTMRIDAEELREALRKKNEMTGPLFKMERDPRLTPMGAFLRRSSLDELPQLLNVLRGDMTLIGPRALSPVPSRYARWQLTRFELTPGIACSWQASRRGESDFDEWMRSDLNYVARGDSFRADLRLLIRTLLAVVTGSGSR